MPEFVVGNCTATDRVLELRGLKAYFFTEAGVVKAVDGVDLWVNRGEILGVVGESGCGKSMMARSILRLLPPPGRIVAGEVLLDGQDLLKLSDAQMRNVRGDGVAMVFQEPMTSLNPVYTVGNQLAEGLLAHRPGMNRKERSERVVEILRMVGIPSPEQRVGDYPHQLSGGMRQRVMIAMALACGSPRLLIADEPTTALDVTIQAQILELFQRLQAERHMSVMLITHDFGVVAEIADRVAVMYAGSVVEYADVDELFENPRHPYTQGLLRALPQPDRDLRKGLLYTIPGIVPNLLDLPRGCKFFHRCPYGNEGVCQGREPLLEPIATDHWVRCVRVGDIVP